MILNMRKFSINLEKCLETVTTRLSCKLFLHKILIFFLKMGGVQTYYWTPKFYSGGPRTPWTPRLRTPIVLQPVRVNQSGFCILKFSI